MLKGKKVLIIGLAKSGTATLKLVHHLQASIVVNDSREREDVDLIEEYEKLGVEFVCGGHPDELFERDFDFVVRNPGINYHKPFLLRLKERGIPVYTEIELAYQVSQPQTYLAVTGTNGKTTTVKLLNHVFESIQDKVLLAGNVGVPLCELVLKHDLIHNSGYTIILEMSNFQLLDIDQFKPNVSTVINLTPDHLDYMASLDEYYASKMRIFMNQNEDDIYVENLDDPILQEYLNQYPPRATRLTYSLEKEAMCCLKGDDIYYDNQLIMNIKDIQMVGKHNVQNVMIAIVFALLCKQDVQAVVQAIKEFKGVEHRIEYVDTISKVKYYNDSKATNTDAAIIALKAFDQPVILLMGGFEKGLDLEEMSTYKDKIKHLVCFGAAKDRFASEMKCPSTFIELSLKDALLKAQSIAEEGDVILLSPSTSSFDEFKSYEERGRIFKGYIEDMKKS